MISIVWDFAGFNISIKSQYTDIYSLEKDIGLYFGSSNFSEIDSLDWFLVDKQTAQLSFLLLTVPSVVRCSLEDSLLVLNKLQTISLSECIRYFAADVLIQHQATYFVRHNSLVVSSDSTAAFYKVPVADGLDLWLSQTFGYLGFALNNATAHIDGYCLSADDAAFQPLLLNTLAFFNDDAYEAMDEQNTVYLSRIHKLEKDCSDYLSLDKRVAQLMAFTMNLKTIFYNIETDKV